MNYHSLVSTLSLTLLLQVPVVFLSSCSTPNFLQQNSTNIPKQFKDQENLSGIGKTIKDKAQKFTVRIDYPNGNGSGVIVAKNNDTYYVLTAQHVIENSESYEIVTPDGKKHQVDSNKITTKGSVDVAVVQFQSGETYQVATLADYKTELEEDLENQQQELREQAVISKKLEEEIKANTTSIVEGEIEIQNTSIDEILQMGEEQARQSLENSEKQFDKFQNRQYTNQWLFLLGWSRFNNTPNLSLSAGKDFTIREPSSFGKNNKAFFVSRAFDTLARSKRYELSYSNFSQGGMSGGAVLDTTGRVVGIHAAAEGERVGLGEIQLGFSLGVPIKAFLSVANQMGIKPEWLQVEKSRPQPLTEADKQSIAKNLFELEPPGQNGTEIDWLNYGNNLMRIERFQQAMTAFDEAIKIKPDFYQAYYAKGSVVQAQVAQKVLSEMPEMLKMSLSEMLKMPLIDEISTNNLENTDQQMQEYMASTTQSMAKITQSMAKITQMGLQALPSFQKASEIEPDFYPAWKQKGITYSQVVSLDNMSQLSNKELDDTIASNNLNQPLSPQAVEAGEKALTAYNKATALNPSDSMLYSSKALLLEQLSRPQEAIEAYGQAIKIDPTPIDYQSRSNLYCQIGDQEKAEADIKSAEELGYVNYAKDLPVCGYEQK